MGLCAGCSLCKFFPIQIAVLLFCLCPELSLTIANLNQDEGVDDANDPDGDWEYADSDEYSDDNPGDKENDGEDDINLCPRQ